MGRLVHQIRYDLLIFRRNPAAVFFSVLVPLLVFVAFGLLLSAISDEGSGPVFASSMVTFAVVGATMVNLAMTMTIRRERGLLKRVWATPLSPWMFVASQGVVGLVVSAALTATMVALGAVIVDLAVSAAGLAVVLVALVVGATSFVAIGLALSSFVPSEQAAPSVVQAVAIPLYVISGIFVPLTLMPSWVAAIARVLPVHHLAQAFRSGFEADVTGVPLGHLAVVALWGLAAAFFVTRRFRWLPSS